MRWLKPELAIERRGVAIERVHRDRAYGQLVRGAQQALKCVEQQTAADADALMAGRDSQTGDERDRDGEVL